MGAPEADVLAGDVTTNYDPKWVLSPDKKEYVAVTGTVKSELPHPMSIKMMFWSGPGSDGEVTKVASVHEAIRITA
jgi:hypothetical protein